VNAVTEDAAKRNNDLAEIQDGLREQNTGNRWYWVDKARSRIKALTEDGAMFGLVPHEVQERAALQRMLAAIGEEIEDHG
jgi:hypothetical protein